MKNRSPSVRQLRNAADFTNTYMNGDGQPWCDTSSRASLAKGNFCLVSGLEHIRAASKRVGITKKKFYTIVLITAGTVKEKIGFRHYELGPQTLYFVGVNQLHSTGSWSKDIQGYFCIFDADYFLLCLKNQVKLNEFPFFQSERDVSMKLSVAEQQGFVDLFSKLKAGYCARKSHNDDMLVRLYLNVFLLEASRLYEVKEGGAASDASRRQVLVSEYQKLVAKHFLDKREVTDYAAMLHVTPHYLNDTVKEFTRRSAREFIHDALLVEAKGLLIQTELTITQIAGQLNFSDQSYFSRFFRSKAGKSPNEYRMGHSRFG